MNKEGFNYSSPIVVDLETSGLDKNKHEIIQLAVLHVASGDKIEMKLKFNKKKATKEALEINCYSKKKWKKAIEPAEAVKLFAAFCKKHTSSIKYAKKTGNAYEVAILAGYNIMGFDKDFLIKLFKDHDVYAPFDYRVLDVYAMCLFLFPNLHEYNLEAMLGTLDIEHGELHDAAEDVEATANILSAILCDTDDNPPEWAVKRNDESRIPF